MLLAVILLMLSLLIGTLLYFCIHLSPLINMIFNIPILLLWTVGMGLMIWNMYGTLGHSCSINNWGNDDGVMICNQYKAMFAFVVIGWLCQIALIVLDVRARRHQSALGKYNKMRDSQDFNLKVDPMHSRESSVHDLPMGAGLDGAAQRLHQHDSQAPQSDFARPAPSRQESFYSTAAPTYTTQPQYQDAPYGGNSNSSGYQAYNPNPQFDPAYTGGHNVHSMQDFRNPGTAPPTYDNYYGR